MVESSDRIVKATISSIRVSPRWFFLRMLLHRKLQDRDARSDRKLLLILERRIGHRNHSGSLSDRDEHELRQHPRSARTRRSRGSRDAQRRFAGIVPDVDHGRILAVLL